MPSGVVVDTSVDIARRPGCLASTEAVRSALNCATRPIRRPSRTIALGAPRRRCRWGSGCVA